MGAWLSRRRLLGTLVAVAGTAITSDRTHGAQVGTLDYCYWRTADGPVCRSDRKSYDRWCYWCNDPGTSASAVECERRVVGTC